MTTDLTSLTTSLKPGEWIDITSGDARVTVHLCKREGERIRLKLVAGDRVEFLPPLELAEDCRIDVEVGPEVATLRFWRRTGRNVYARVTAPRSVAIARCNANRRPDTASPPTRPLSHRLGRSYEEASKRHSQSR